MIATVAKVQLMDMVEKCPIPTGSLGFSYGSRIRVRLVLARSVQHSHTDKYK